MPFDGSGNFSRDYNWQQDRDNDIRIMAERMDGEFDNYAGGLNMTFLRSGIVPMQGNLNLNNNRILSINNGTAASPAIKFNGDANSGFYLSSLNNVGIATNGLARLVVNNSGITVTGNATVSGTLDVTGNVNFGSASFGDSNFNLALSSGNPRISFDANDFLQYDRVNDRLLQNIGGSTIARTDSTGFRIFAGNILGTAVPSVANIHFVTGSATNNAYLRFLNNVGSQTAAIGNNAFANALEYSSASGHLFTGGSVQFGDANYSAYMSGGSPVLLFDTNDYLDFNRSTNTYSFRTGSASQLTVTPTTVSARAEFSAPRFALDSTGYFSTSSGNPVVAFDTSDYILYNRAADTMQFAAAAVTRLTLSATGAAFAGAITGVTTITTTGAVSVGTDLNVSGNTTTTGETRFGDTSFKSYVSSGTPVFMFDNSGGSNDYISYNRSSDAYNFQIASATRMSVTSTAMSHVGSVGAGTSMTVGTTLSVGGTSTFTGAVTASAGVSVPAGQTFNFGGGVGNNYLNLSGTTVQLVCDTGDVFRYDRSNNRFEYVIGSAMVAYLTATDFYMGSGAITDQLGYKDIQQVVQAGSYTLAITDRGKHVYYAGAGGHTYTVPPNSTTAFPIGSSIVIVNNGSGNLTIARGAGVTMEYGAVTPTNANRTLARQSMATLIKVATDTWFISGNNLV